MYVKFPCDHVIARRGGGNIEANNISQGLEVGGSGVNPPPHIYYDIILYYHMIIGVLEAINVRWRD